MGRSSEFLESQGIDLASRNERKHRAPRRAKKRLPGSRLSMPMPPPAKIERQRLQDRIEKGEFMLGEEVVEQENVQFKVTSDSDIVATQTKFSARKIPLLEIRKKILAKHEKMGLVRINENFLSLNHQQIEIRLTQLGEKYDNDLSENDLREKLVLLARQRYLKVWHDHSSIAGHTYFLVLVTPIYDEAFYYTDREIMESTGKNINIQSIVERPEIHIIGRSGASIANQMLFNKCRQECMGQIDEPVTSESGIAIHYVIRFFSW